MSLPLITLSLSLRLALLPLGTLYMYTPYPEVEDIKGTYESEFEVELTLERIFFVRGSVLTVFLPSPLHGFDLSYADYVFGFGARARGIEVGFEHECFHPLIAYVPRHRKSSLYEGAIERLYVKVTLKKEFP